MQIARHTFGNIYGDQIHTVMAEYNSVPEYNEGGMTLNISNFGLIQPTSASSWRWTKKISSKKEETSQLLK